MVSLHFTISITISIIFTILRTSYGSYESYENCSSLVSCGNLHNIGYPFWGIGRARFCGHPLLQLQCPLSNHSDEYPTMTIKLKELGLQQISGADKVTYRVRNITKSNANITIKLQELLPDADAVCPIRFINTTDKFTLFSFSSDVQNISLFHCPGRKTGYVFETMTCRDAGATYNLLNLSDSRNNQEFESCKSIIVPVLKQGYDDLRKGNGTLLGLLKQGLEVDYLKEYSEDCFSCEYSGGKCGSSISGFTCHCLDSDPQVYQCSKSGEQRKLWLILGLAIPGGLFILIALNVGIWCFIQPKSQSSTTLSRTISCDPANSDIEIGSSLNGIAIFSYNELQEATKNFDLTRELGDGGCGIVYYGKLRDGREVAIKRLYQKNYKKVGQFMNEVEILTKLLHQNLVTLYGCTSRHSRELLLVYEYVPNGTVADHLYGVRKGSAILTWSIRMKIAIETAYALLYLHDSKIIHRDVKTKNILLDNNFSVKVADFGLSRFFPFDATHVSTAPQGTPGYLDPEYHRNYQVTSKSDVYSFGVVLIELISSLPAIDISRNEHEIKLSDYAMNRIQNGELGELVDRQLGFESDFKVKRMVTLVAELAFQCLQQEKEVRPSMEEVLEALKRIKSVDYEALEAEEMGKSRGTMKPTPKRKYIDVDHPSMDTQHPTSPISVIGRWVSRSTASNPSA